MKDGFVGGGPQSGSLIRPAGSLLVQVQAHPVPALPIPVSAKSRRWSKTLSGCALGGGWYGGMR